MKVIIITGGGSGIGGAAAKQLLARGDAVVIAGRSSTRLNAFAATQKDSAGELICCPANVSKPDDVEQIIDRALEWKGRIDAVINCAGAATMQPTCDLTVEQCRQSPLFSFQIGLGPDRIT